MVRDILRHGDGQEFEIAAMELHQGIAGAHGMLAARRDGEAEAR